MLLPVETRRNFMNLNQQSHSSVISGLMAIGTMLGFGLACASLSSDIKKSSSPSPTTTNSEIVNSKPIVDIPTKHPTTYIDRGICPGEGCSYEGRAKVLSTVTVYAAPSLNSRQLFKITRGKTITSLDSEVHTIAGRFVVKQFYEGYQPGDVIWVYTYLGEGMFKVWYRGSMKEENLDFSPWGGSGGKRCERDASICWGELDRELNMTWWLKIQDNRRRVGWIRVNNNLDMEISGMITLPSGET
jgi:hypothetical protein